MSTNFEQVLEQLEKGTLRSAQKINGEWAPNLEVKEAILQAFREGQLVDMNGFVEKHTLPPQKFTASRGIRIVPGGSSVRRGSYLASGVIIMPPSYINVGAYIDQGTLIDSHVLVGSCAQIGKKVHLSTGVQIGGVLEPVNAAPVIIEDECFIGADAVIVEGIVIGKRAVIAPGVILSKGIPIFDCVHEKEIEKGKIPENAVVVSGTRPLSSQYSWAHKKGLQIACALIIKYRDEKSDAALTLEQALR